MKYLLFAMLMFLGVNCFGQVKVDTILSNYGSNPRYTVTDTLSIIKVSKHKIETDATIEIYKQKALTKDFFSVVIHFTGTGVYSLSPNDLAKFTTVDDSIISVKSFNSNKKNTRLCNKLYKVFLLNAGIQNKTARRPQISRYEFSNNDANFFSGSA